MSKGGSYGGGHSSLGYLFGSEKPASPPPVVTPAVVTKPPWGDDNTTEKPPQVYAPASTVSNYYTRTEGQNTGHFITDRPSTKVQSVPGGDSSLGYLFGSK
ncbi:Spiral1 [Thalictrum thalictroides]|uniref:Spiral1 n=1 Tax=Thalictrum thalictroides TaxID=46969 RepID=A0A7J6VYK4_THATH|nr:Spiral1 [Thalictrum thalictroides]